MPPPFQQRLSKQGMADIRNVYAGQLQTGEFFQEKAENERLRQREGNIEQRVQSALQDGREQLNETQRQTSDLIEDLQRRLESMATTDLPVGLGLEDGDRVDLQRDQLIWVEPQDGRDRATKTLNPLAFPTAFGPAQKPLEDAAALAEALKAQYAQRPPRCSRPMEAFSAEAKTAEVEAFYLRELALARAR